MAELIFSTIGQAIGSRLPGAFSAIGAALGRAGGAWLGRSIDQQIFGGVPHYEGPRLTDLHLQGSTEGASLPVVFGRVRIAGQVIWAARFKEHVENRDVGGKGGPRATSTTYRYTLSFAVGLCEGEVTRVARVWANGEPLDLSEFSWRLHAGSEDQTPDSLIEAVEGLDNAPAYRGVAYVVFEDMPLERFGNVMPQLSFEVVRPVPSPDVRFEERVKGVCLIPGAGEFIYATEPVMRHLGIGRQVAENVHAERNRANLLVSLDQLAADFPNCETVMLVVAWFGDDLRCGECEIRPGVEIASKLTTPFQWRAGGVDRGGARVVSPFEGAPAFGGTPSDISVLQAIAELKARGYRVGLYPFLLMDIPVGNGLPDPYGGASQAVYPWRGRITIHPAPGETGSPDKTAAAGVQISAFFGAAAPSHFGSSGGLPTYSGPSEWSYRRFILHYARLAALAGGVDAFIIGSELRGLTTARDGASTYPAVAALAELAGDVRAMLGSETAITYAADWSEYGGHHPQDGTGDVFFHLDPLWANPNIDVVGVDWYAPLTDWRDGAAHLDASSTRGIHDPDYLRGRIEAGENYEWYYASEADRVAQVRTSITDLAYHEPWVYRAKDVRNFWAREHFDRPGGVRAMSPTAWIPESKPIWFVELGCAAVDKGSNAPNLFVDEKSDENALPPFSNGGRDDLIQRRMLDAYLQHWDPESVTNPVSGLTGKPMIEQIMLWCWDARPHPAFPARTDVWADGAAWRRGHWLSGRAGLSELGDVTQTLCQRAGVGDADVSALLGAVSGYIVDAPASARAVLEPLMLAHDFTAVEQAGRLVFFHRAAAAPLEIDAGDLAAASAGDKFAERGDAAETPVEARIRFLDPARDYLIAGVSARRLDRAEGGVLTMEAPMVLETDAAETMAQRALSDLRAGGETLHLALGPAHLALEPGDAVKLAGGVDLFEIVRIEDAETRRLELRRQRAAAGALLALGDPTAPDATIAPTPALAILDLPPLPGFETDERPLSAVRASPWRGSHDLFAGAALTRRATIAQPAAIGELLWPLAPGPVDRWDDGNVVRIALADSPLAGATREAVLNGANAFAVEADGEWEVLQARTCDLVAPNEYELRGLLRGRLGSAHAMRAPHPAGARIVVLNDRLARVAVGAHEWGEEVVFSAPPYGAAASDPRALHSVVTLPHAAARPWAPAHLRARRVVSGDVEVSWVRCARLGGDAWGPGEPPLGAAVEAYRLEILDGDEVVRVLTLGTPAFTYDSVAQTADFGSLPGLLRFRVAQLDDAGVPGLNTELTITL